jgi:hypothetical protein
MSHPQTAFLLNFIIPGVGLAYLGKKSVAMVNFGIAVILPLAACWFWPETSSNWVRYLILAIAAGSGGFAHAAAEQDVGKKKDV